MDFCRRCGAWFGGGRSHRCLPQYVCLDVDKQIWCNIYAQSPKEAAEKFAEHLDYRYGEVPRDHTVEVLEPITEKSRIFEVGIEVRAHYEALERGFP